MKKYIIPALVLLLAGTLQSSARPATRRTTPGTTADAANAVSRMERKFEILVHINDNASELEADNQRLRSLQSASGNQTRGIFLDLLKTGFGSSMTQKTVNATSNVLSLGLNYLTTALRGHRDEWLRTARQQCTLTKKLKSETTIEDFYAAPSTRGAMDPENLKFKGFGCRHYLECTDQPGRGREVFFLFCKLRKDDEGMRHIVNHGKFVVDLDTLVFNPTFCGLPNDSSGGLAGRFDFEKRKNLTLNMRVRIYSSWMNEAIIPSLDQQLGEFTITARIDRSKLRAIHNPATGLTDTLFVYDPNDPDFRRLVQISGDCFIVPRSFTGTGDGTTYSPCWGTGQYRMEMDITESCQVNEDYYMIRESGNGAAVAAADGRPGNRKWDKAKWKTEWKAMNARKKNTSFLGNLWASIVTAYKGAGWIETFTDPLTTAIYTRETAKLNEWFGLSTTGAAPTQKGAMPTQKGATATKPQGGKP